MDANGQNITLAGDWTNSDAYLSGANTVTMDSSGNRTLVTGGTADHQDFNNLTINKASTGGVTLTTNDLGADGAFRVTTGTFDANDLFLTVDGNVSRTDDRVLMGTGTWTCGGIPVRLKLRRTVERSQFQRAANLR